MLLDFFESVFFSVKSPSWLKIVSNGANQFVSSHDLQENHFANTKLDNVNVTSV